MYTIKFTYTERETLLDLLRFNISELKCIRDTPEFTTDLTFKLLELESLYDSVSESEYQYECGYDEDEDEDDYIHDYVSRKFSEIDNRLKVIEGTLWDDLK